MTKEHAEPLISVIIPVYNAERYIVKCLISTMNQTYENLEILLVNDGSTDNSGHICEKFSKDDKRIKVFHKENGGVSSARNIGLKEAKGQYISFVDPDDWIDLNTIERLYRLAVENEAEISACGYVRKTPDNEILNSTIKQSVKSYTQIESLNSILDESGFKGFACNKLFSATSIKNLLFDESIHFCEDLLFCCQAISNSTKVVYDSTPLYHYVMHKNIQFSEKKVTSLDALLKIISLLNNKEGVNIARFKDYFMHMNISLLMNGIQQKCDREIKKRLRYNLSRFNINELSSRNVKLSCVVSKVNTNLFYIVWKLAK